MRKDEYEKLHGSLDGFDSHHTRRLKKDEIIELYGEDAWEAEKKKRHNYFHKYHSIKPKYPPEGEERDEYNKKRREKRQANRDAILEKEAAKRATKYGRARMLKNGYAHQDRKTKRGKCTLTEEQIMQFWNDGCYYCGETDWKKLGADRMDNDKGHTIENCVCACAKCNKERGNMPFHIFKFMKHHPDVKAIDIFPVVKTASSTKAA